MKRYCCSLLILLAATAFSLSASTLSVDITVDLSVPGVWTYTVTNTEAPGSNLYIYSFTLGVSAPVTVTNTPVGWTVDTSDPHSVVWSNGDQFPGPYPHDLAPGAFLTFSISSPGSNSFTQGAFAASWDHNINDQGPFSLTTQVQAPVPEPWTGSTVGGSLLALGFFLKRRTKNRAK